MRPLRDLLAEEPLALTGAVTATGNVLLLLGVDASPELIGGVNIAVASWFGLLRWLVVPVKRAAAQSQAAYDGGRMGALADVASLAHAVPPAGEETLAAKPAAKRPARRR